MVVCSGGSWSFTPGDEDLPCSTGSGAPGSCHDGACVATPTCSSPPPVVDPCVALFCDPMGSWVQDSSVWNGMVCSVPSSGVFGTCSNGTCVPTSTSDDGGTGTPPIITIPPGGGTGGSGGGDADGGTTTPPIGTGDGGAGGPGPGGTAGPPNARCDNNFSFGECRGLLIGQVSANNNICASGGPSFPDGSWDCNILIPNPNPNPNPNPVGDAGVTDGGEPDTGTGTGTTDAGAPPPATTAQQIQMPVYKAFITF